MSSIIDAQFGDFPNRSGQKTYSYAELLAQLQIDIGTTGQAGKGVGLFAPAGNFTGMLDNTSVNYDWRGNGAGVDPTVEYDDLGFYSNGDSENFVIPNVVPAITRVQVWLSGSWGNGTPAGERQIFIRKNLSFNFSGSMGVSGVMTVGAAFVMAVYSGVFEVVAGDKLSFQLTVTNDGTDTSQFTVPRGGLVVVA